MNRHVNAIAGRLSLRPPQRHSLEILDRITEIVPPKKGADADGRAGGHPQRVPDRHGLRARVSVALLRAGDRRGQDAADGRVHQLSAPGARHQQLLRPRAEPDDLQQADRRLHARTRRSTCSRASPSSPPTRRRSSPATTTKRRRGTLFDELIRCKVNIFNISKINSEVRGGKSPRIKRLSEYIGESYFDYLAGLPDLVLLMDESHRYRASRRRAGDQRAEADPRPGTDGDAVRRNEQGPGAVQERHLRLPARQGDGGRLREGAGRRHAQELQPGGHVRRRRSSG